MTHLPPTPARGGFASAAAPIHHFRVRDYGPCAALLEVDSAREVEDLFAYLDYAAGSGQLAGVVEIVPAARTVLVIGDSPQARADALSLADQWVPQDGHAHQGTMHDIEVDYTGPDLDTVAAQTSLTPEEVIAIHSGTTYRVAFMGFAPGFAYLTGLDPVLHLPRRSTPRTAVPPRSVAIAGEYSAVYPRTSPGGWNLLGQSVQAMWDDSADPPYRLAPGDQVRFHPR